MLLIKEMVKILGFVRSLVGVKSVREDGVSDSKEKMVLMMEMCLLGAS